MNEYIKSFKGFYEYLDAYINRYAARPQGDKHHGFAIQFAGDYYNEYQKILKEKGAGAALTFEDEFLSEASKIFVDFQDAVAENNVEKLKSIRSETKKFIRRGEDKAMSLEAVFALFNNDIQQMKLDDEKVKNCQTIVDMDIKIYGEITDKTKEIMEVYHFELVEGKVRKKSEKTAEKTFSLEEGFYGSAVDDMNNFLKLHDARLKEVEKIAGKKTLVVNAYAGTGAGKTTACLAAVAELKKMGYTAEYVSEYAKELVYDKPELLDGSKENQLHILGEQLKRLDRFMGKVDIIVTDASILLNSVYLAKPDQDYEAAISKLYKQYENFNFFVRRGEDFVQEGRMENREESIQKDQQIRDILEKNDLFYGNFNHKTVDELAKKIEITYKRITLEAPEQDSKGRAVHEKSYQAIAYLKQTTDKPTYLYGNSPEILIAQLQSWNRERSKEMQFHSCYIRKFNPETNRYENPARFEVASGKDITPIYLNLPHMEREEFLQVVGQLKKDGAKFNVTKKAFYVTKGEADLNKFAAYLPIAGTHAAAGENRSQHELNYSVVLDKKTNEVEIRVEGKKPFQVKGEHYNIDFSTLPAESIRELIEKFVLPGKELEPDNNKGLKSPQKAVEKDKGRRESIRSRLEGNKGKIEALNKESSMLEKVANERFR